MRMRRSAGGFSMAGLPTLVPSFGDRSFGGRSFSNLSMTGLSRRWNPNLQPRAVPGIRFYREFTREQAHSFANYRRAFAGRFEFGIGERSGECKALAIVFHGELQIPGPLRQAHEHVMRSAVFADVHQTFLHNARQLTTNSLCQIHALQF